MLKSKLPLTGPTIFSVMTQMAKDFGAINLAQGFPDFPVYKHLADLVDKYIRLGYNQYAPMMGVSELRERIAELVEQWYGHRYNPDTEINITVGATQAIYTIISALVHEGDEVMIFEPAFDSYLPAINIHGGKAVFVKLKQPDYSIDWNEAAKLLTSRTRLIIINSPHNPTGSLLSSDDLDKLAKMIQGSKAFVLSDEVYEHILFDGAKHHSIASHPKLAERSFVVTSFGKTFHHTGWRIGYCLAPEHMMKEFRKVHQYQVFSVSTPMQFALADFLANTEPITSIRDFYQQKRDFFVAQFNDSPLQLTPTKGTFFQLIDFTSVSKERDIELAIQLVQKAGVAAIPIAPFYHEGQKSAVLRFCFAKSDETLQLAANKIILFCKK